MALTSGINLGSYQIGSPLGAGGMGEVYRARDSRLGREVAVKVLPAEMAGNAELMARFEREAQLLASLNHTNIATIYGLEESGATRALVMELVEGPTLADRIAQGPIPLAEALPIAKQIAEALEYAHEKGIIHRDLKPANVKVTPEGRVKVLDFGLAKALATEPSASAISNSPTTIAATRAGVILGTAAYMAPEQAKAKPLDRRADIWAFGCVLYEMLTGKATFNGETTSDVLAAVLMKEPDWKPLAADTPASIQTLLRRCVAKDPKQRLQAIGEARIAIEESVAQVSSPAGAMPVSSAAGSAMGTLRSAQGQASPLQRLLPWTVALALAVLSAALAWRTYFHPNALSAEAVVSFVPAPPDTTFRSTGFGAGPVVVSPDGKQPAFSATGPDGITKIWVRPLSAATATPVAGTDDAAFPFWSADSRSLGFYADGKLKTVDLSGGSVQVLADASPRESSAWGPNGIILFKPPRGSEIYKIAVSGGAPVAATRLGKDEASHNSPLFLPDGKHFIYNASTIHGLTHIARGSLDSYESKLVLDGASSRGYAAGLLFFSKGGDEVFAQPFDPGTGILSGKAVPLAKAGSVSAAGDSILAYQGASSTAHLQWFDRSGNPMGTLGEVAEYFAPKISPDGKQVLARVVDPQSGTDDLWSFPVSGGVSTRLTFGPASIKA